MSFTTKFKSVTTPSGKKAFEAYVAAYGEGEQELIFGAPTLEALNIAWEKYTSMALDKARAQHVWLVKAEK